MLKNQNSRRKRSNRPNSRFNNNNKTQKFQPAHYSHHEPEQHSMEDNIHNAEGNMATQEYKVFLGSLPPSSTQASIKKIFSKFGEIQEVSLVIKDKFNRYCRGFGYLTVGDQAVFEAILSAKVEIEGRTIFIEPYFSGRNLISIARTRSSWPRGFL